MKAAVYARTSTLDQEPLNQLAELRRYVEARGWTATEYVDRGVSGAKDRRPALNCLMADAMRRRIDVVCVWRLDRFGRSLKHLITAIGELNAAGVTFVSLGENIDTGSPTGRLLLGVMGSFAEFERDRIRERVMAGLARARSQGVRLGRRPLSITDTDLQATAALSVRDAARALGVPRSVLHRARLSRRPIAAGPTFAPV